MMHKAWFSIEDVPYYFSRSSIKFQGHTGWKNRWFGSNLSKITRPVAAIKSLRFALFVLERPLVIKYNCCYLFYMLTIWYLITKMQNVKSLHCHNVYNTRMAETSLATAIYVWPADVDTMPLADLIPLQRLHVLAHSRDPHPAIKLWCQVPFTKSKTIARFEMYFMRCFLKSKYIKSRIFNHGNRWIIKKVMLL